MELRLSARAGGPHAMQAMEVSESVGVAADEAKPLDPKAKETPLQEVAAEHNPPPSAEKTWYRVRREGQCGKAAFPV